MVISASILDQQTTRTVSANAVPLKYASHGKIYD